MEETAAVNKTLDKLNFKILYVNSGMSRLNFVRGEVVLKNFSVFYEKYANTTVLTTSPEYLHNITEHDLKHFNILWLDNVSDPLALKHITDIQIKLMTEADPKWKETLTNLQAESEEKAVAYASELKERVAQKLRVIYAIDEFIWEAPVGRAQSIQVVRMVEAYMNLADNIIVPTNEMKEAIHHFGFCNKSIDISVIPTTVHHDFFPLFKRTERNGSVTATQMPKARILIKGIVIPENIQEFISLSYKDFDITISSVGELNESVLGLIERQKINHIHHWANPGSNKKNFTATYAIERDQGFDIFIYCMENNLEGKFYDITMGDEDILFAISSGILPICGTEHVGYEPTHLSNASGLVFGKDTKFEDIKKMVRSHYYDFTKFNMAFNKCRVHLENRVTTSPFIMGAYFGVLIGRKAAEKMVKEKEEASKKEETVTVNADITSPDATSEASIENKE